jgi:hypothetical protein
MTFRTVPPDPNEFPKVKLLWPLLGPVVVAGIVWGAELGGHVWSIHGDAAVLIFLFFLSLIVGVAALTFTLPQALRALMQFPSLRTPANLFVAGTAAVFMCVSAFYVCYAVLKVTAS